MTHTLVVGAGGPTGRAVVAARTAAGDAVTAVVRTAAAFEPGVRVVAGIDVRDPEAPARVLAAAPAPDALVYLPGPIITGPLAAIDPTALTALFEVNVSAALRFAVACTTPPAAARAVVLFGCAGMQTPRAFVRTAGYAAVKLGLETVARSLAREWAGRVRVNVVAPGRIAGADTVSAHDDAPQVTAADVAAAVDWLLSPAAQAVTGATIPVARGFGL